MPDFSNQSMAGSRFENVSLAGSRFEVVDLNGVRIRNVDLSGAVIRGVYMVDVEIDGEFRGLRVNGVDVGGYVEAELDRRYPQRALMRPSDAAGFRAAWDALEPLWQGTVERARGLDPDLLHERVDDEWSFIETLRHLVFATDAWVLRALLGDPSPYYPLGLPHDEMDETPNVPRVLDARPSLDEVLAVRAERVATVRRVLAELTDERLAGTTEPVVEPGYPESESFPVFRCLFAIVNEEWEHRLFAERDLDVLAARNP